MQFPTADHSVTGTKRRGGDRSAGTVFGILWHALADILGTAAAATLLRRAAQRAMPHWPELAGLSIVREALEYRYTVPPAWEATGASADPPPALCALARELWPLLIDLTGTVVVNRLAQIPDLRDRGIVPETEVRP